MKKLVRFEDGRYGVLVGPSRYTDLKSPQFSWSSLSEYFEKDCKGTEERARQVYNRLGSKYEVIESDSIFDALKSWIMRQLQKEPAK